MKATLASLLLAYCAYGAIMVWLHPRFIYPFQPEDRVLPGFERIERIAPDGTKIYMQEHPGDGPVVLYFMGNAGALGFFESAFERHIAAGRNVIALEYRGGAGRPGIAGEAALKSDALLAADYAFSKDRTLIVQGYSLGTGLATHVAARRDVDGVILTAPYDRLCRLMAASSFLPACLLPVQSWNSISDARRIKAPILALHGDNDALVPPHYSAAFLDLPTATRLMIEGAGHTDIGGFPKFDDAIQSFIDGITRP